MADHSKPTNTSLYTDYTSQIDARFDDITLGLDPAVVTATNLPTGAIRWNSASAKWEKWSGTAWADLATAYNINLAGPITLTANSASDAFRITQTGAGNAFVVEDSANPDSTPFVIDAAGNVVVGYTSTTNYAAFNPNVQSQMASQNAGFAAGNWQNTSGAPNIWLGKSRGAIGTHTIVQSGDGMGNIRFYGSDGTGFIESAAIYSFVDGTPGTNDMPGRLVFSTTADGASSPTERMRITSNGWVGIGGTPVNDRFLNTGTTNSTTTSFTAFNNSFNIGSEITGTYTGFRSNYSTIASAFTVSLAVGFRALQTSIGAGSAITTQYGFEAQSNLTGATNNYGFFSNIASGTGRWNFYANGTAQNYFAGNVGIGVSVPLAKLHISGVGAGADIFQSTGSVNAASGATFSQRRDRAGGLVNNGDTVGIYSMSGYDGTNFIEASRIFAQVDGTPGTNDMPGRLVFSTTPDGSATPVERTRIGSDGTLRHLNDIAFNNATVLTASYDGVSKSVAAEETTPAAVWFRPDGLRMYILGNTGDDITQYTLTTAWDITTAGSPVTFSVAAQDSNLSVGYFRDDGLKFYVVGINNDTVYQYSCSTAWDITTASYDSKSFSVAAQELSPFGVAFKIDGSKMYVVGNSSDTIFEYDLGTAWDVSTAAYNSVSVSVAGFDNNPLDIRFTNDGYKLFMVGNSSDDITEFALSKAWDITTIQRLGEFYVGSQELTPYSIYIKPDLSKFYIIGVSSDTVYQYSMGSGSINLTSDVKVNGKFNVIGTPPATATSTGKQGDIIWDSGYIYICVADNTWKRSAISTW